MYFFSLGLDYVIEKGGGVELLLMTMTYDVGWESFKVKSLVCCRALLFFSWVIVNICNRKILEFEWDLKKKKRRLRNGQHSNMYSKCLPLKKHSLTLSKILIFKVLKQLQPQFSNKLPSKSQSLQYSLSQ